MVKKKILILGASGFLGSYLVDRAVENNLDVYGTFRKKKFVRNKKVKYFFFDTNNINHKFILKKKFDIIVNASGVVDHNVPEKKSFQFFLSHIYPIFLVDNQKKNTKFINIGSMLEDNEGKSEHDIISFYVIVKTIISRISEKINTIYNRKITTIKFGQIYGPCENKNRFISYLIFKKKKKVIHNLINIRNYVYIDDAVDEIFRIMSNDQNKSNVIVYNDQFKSNLQIINYVKNILKLKFIIKNSNKKKISHTLPQNIFQNKIYLNKSISVEEGIVRMVLQKNTKNIYKSKISVIVNSHNGAKYIENCLNSILQQTYQNFEIIFWDNCSSDETEKIIKKISDNRIRYFKSKKFNSLAISRNLATKEAKGEYIAFLDVDDLWMPNKLMKQIYLMITEQSLVSVTNYYVTLGKFGIRYFPQKNSKKFEININKTYKVAFSSLMIHKSVAERFKFNKNFEIIGDFHFIINLSKFYKISFLNENLVNYYLHSLSYSQKNYEKHALEIKYFLKLEKNNLSKNGNELLLNTINYLEYCNYIKNENLILFIKKLRKDKYIKNKLFFSIKIFLKMYLI